jgi:hypothetical protein
MHAKEKKTVLCKKKIEHASILAAKKSKKVKKVGKSHFSA